MKNPQWSRKIENGGKGYQAADKIWEKRYYLKNEDTSRLLIGSWAVSITGNAQGYLTWVITKNLRAHKTGCTK